MFRKDITNLLSETDDIAQSMSILAYALTDKKLHESVLLNQEDIARLLWSMSNYLQRIESDFEEIDYQRRKEIASLKARSKAKSKRHRFVKPL